METKRFISWRRVSTFKQNRSGLGLEAQKEIIRYFVERDGGELIADYAECYTGTELSGCMELRKAMAKAKKEKAILVIAKSDRFRNTAEALKIYEEMGDGNIMFCDLPHTDKFTLTLFFALAEREALIVSIRTKQALAVKKAQGAKLGAQSEKYIQNYNKKEQSIKDMEAKKRGQTKRARFLASRDVTAFVKVLGRVFPQACSGSVNDPIDFTQINTQYQNRMKILQMMRDFKDMDADGKLFAKWDLSGDVETATLQHKLANLMSAIKKSLATE